MGLLVNLPVSLDLKDRTLWFDGCSSVSTARLSTMILEGKSIDKLFPEEVDDDVRKFNKYNETYKLDIKSSIEPLDKTYLIPDKYCNINLKVYFLSLFNNYLKVNPMSDDDIEIRINRILEEVRLIKEYNIENLIRTAIYIVDVFEEKSVVWGTGRGSSCACYCLYLLGLHEVDSVKYDLDLDEFFR